MSKKFQNKNSGKNPRNTRESSSSERREFGRTKPFPKEDNRGRKAHSTTVRADSRVDETLIYGFHAVREILLNPKRKIQTLYLTNPDQFKDDEDVQEIVDEVNVKIISKSELDAKLPYDSVHQGIAVKASRLPERGLEEFLNSIKDKEKSCIVILDQVTDPHNIGAILRSACVFGADAVIVQDKNAPELNPTMTKIACGAVEHITYLKEVNLSRSIETLQKNDYWCIALDERGEQTISQAVKNVKKVALVLGAEGPGLRPLVAKTCDQLAQLPVFGNIPSLNVSNAAAVALYEVVRE